MVIHMSDMKHTICDFIDREIICKSPSDKKLLYVGMQILAPKLIDKYVEQYKEMLVISEILNEDNMVCIEELESFFSQLLTKVNGYTIMGVKLDAEDVHKLCDIAREHA